ncbi:MAG: 5'-nucleotidase C-terminal domain-containing protein [Lachnospiraceae bacterium]|nr:5'-nucleotidase C-terminal domain-containing protein [Lachnospiraceae bacterium]
MKKVRKLLAGVLSAGCVLLSLPAAPAVVLADEPEYPADVREMPTGDYTGKTVIIHSNDVHGAIDGYAMMTAMKEAFEELGAEVIMADAGDFSQGGPYVNTTEGADAITMMNAAGYDVATIGNHEFDFGEEVLSNNLKKAKFQLICANLTKDGKELLPASWTYKTKGGKTIGFFGLDTAESQTKANPKKTVGLTFLGGKEMDERAQEVVDQLKEDGADLVIGLVHLGVDDTSADAGNRSIDLYKNTKGIDFLVDGHSHTVMTGTPDGEPIQSTGSKFSYIGVLEVDQDGKLADHYLISTEGLAQDEKVEKVAKGIEEVIDKEYGVKIAESEVELPGGGDIGRDQETALGDLTTDAMHWYILQDPSILETDEANVIALENGGGMRDTLPKGDITKKDLNTVFPFGNSVAVVYVTGEELLEALEASTYGTPDPLGGYPQTCGIKFTVDTTKEYDPGDLYPKSTYNRPKSINRVSVESVNGKALDEKATYAVITNDFVAAGGDTYAVFGAKDSFDTGFLLDDVITEYIEKELNGVIPASQYGEPRGDQTIILADSGEKESKEDTEAADSEKAADDSKADEKTEETAAEETVSDDSAPAAEGSYEVQSGDSLWKIAKEKLSDGTRWEEIYELNKDIIADPRMIYTGQTLKLPEAA